MENKLKPHKVIKEDRSEESLQDIEVTSSIDQDNKIEFFPKSENKPNIEQLTIKQSRYNNKNTQSNYLKKDKTQEKKEQSILLSEFQTIFTHKANEDNKSTWIQNGCPPLEIITERNLHSPCKIIVKKSKNLKKRTGIKSWLRPKLRISKWI